MADEAKAVVDLLRTMNLTIREAENVCERAKFLLGCEVLAKKEMTAQCECAVIGSED